MSRAAWSCRIAGLLCVFVPLLLLSGCWVYSVEPLYDEHLLKSDPDLVFDQTIAGDWGYTDGDCLWILTVISEGQAYAMTMAPSTGCKPDEKIARYQGHVLMLGSHRFLDVRQQPDQLCDLCLPVHSFFLISRESDALTLIPISRDWLAKALEEKKVKLTYLGELGKSSDVTLTASPKELKDFVRKYADDKSVFNPASDLTFKFKRR